MSGEGKKQLNVRVSEQVMNLVDKAAYILHRSKGQVIEDAIQEFAKKHGIGESYRLHIKNGMMILIKTEGDSIEVVETEALNGVAPEVIAKRYSSKFHQDVPLVVDK